MSLHWCQRKGQIIYDRLCIGHTGLTHVTILHNDHATLSFQSHPWPTERKVMPEIVINIRLRKGWNDCIVRSTDLGGRVTTRPMATLKYVAAMAEN